MQHIAVDHAAAARAHDMLTVRSAVEDGALADIEKLNALVPMPGGLAGEVVCSLHAAGNMRKARRVARQIFFPAIGVQVDGGNMKHKKGHLPFFFIYCSF